MERLKIYSDYIYKIRNTVYILAFVIYESTYLLKTVLFTEEQILNIYEKCRYVNMVAYGLFLVCAITAKYTKRELGILLLISISLGIVWYVMGASFLLLSLIVIVGAKDIDARKLFICILATQIVWLVAVIAASQTGLICDYVITERQRHCLGFCWPLIPSTILWMSSAEYICLRDERITLIELIIIAAMGTWMYRMTDSRTAFCLLILLLLLVVVKRYLIKNDVLNKAPLKWIQIVPALIAFMSILLHAVYTPENKALCTLNGLLSGRLQLGKSAIDSYGINLFGHAITWVGESIVTNHSGLGYNYIDCSFLQILISYGVVTIVIFIAAYTLVMRKAIINKQYILIIVIICVMLCGVVEDTLKFIARCPFIVLALADQQKLIAGGKEFNNEATDNIHLYSDL